MSTLYDDEKEKDEGLVGSLTGTPATTERPQEIDAPIEAAPAPVDPLEVGGGGEDPLPEVVSTEEIQPEAAPEEEEESSFFSLKDLALAPFRGVEEFSRDLYGLVDFVSFDSLPDLSNERLLGQSDSTVGSFLTESVNFALGFIPVAGALGKVGKIGKVINITNRAENLMQARGKVKTAWGMRWGRDAVAGAAVDFAFYDEQEERLSTIIAQNPDLANPLTDFLGADENDTEAEGRLKQAIEGSIMGLAVDSLIVGSKAFRRMKRVREAGGTKKQVEESFDDLLPEIEKAALDPSGKQTITDGNLPGTQEHKSAAQNFYEQRTLTEAEQKILDCEC